MLGPTGASVRPTTGGPNTQQKFATLLIKKIIGLHLPTGLSHSTNRLNPPLINFSSFSNSTRTYHYQNQLTTLRIEKNSNCTPTHYSKNQKTPKEIKIRKKMLDNYIHTFHEEFYTWRPHLRRSQSTNCTSVTRDFHGIPWEDLQANGIPRSCTEQQSEYTKDPMRSAKWVSSRSPRREVRKGYQSNPWSEGREKWNPTKCK